MFIKSVNENVKDVFLGNGWSNHVRIQRDGDQFLRTSGMHVTPDVVTKISNRIKSFEEQSARRMSGIYNNSSNKGK